MSEHGISSATTTRAAGRIVGLLAGVVAPTTLLTALAFYFGWRREEAFAGYFGIDPALLELSTSEYVLRSVDALFAPIATALLVAFGVLLLHVLVAPRVNPVYAAPAVGAVGLVALLAGLALAFGHAVASKWVPLQALGLGVGALLLVYALARARGSADGVAALTYIGVAVAIVSTFWATAEYADTRGLRQARKLAADIYVNPQVAVYSKVDLNIDRASTSAGGSEHCQTIHLTRSKRSPYRFAYQGFALLARRAGKYFLTPASFPGVWEPSRAVFILPDDDSIRIELTRGPGYVEETLESTFAGSQRPAFTC